MSRHARPPRRGRLPGARRLLFDATVLGPFRQAPGRTLLAVFAIALGVALGLAVHLVNRVAADEVELAARSLFGLADLSVQGSGTGLPEDLYPALAQLPAVRAASPVIDIRARLPGQARTLQLLGIDPFRVRAMQAPLAPLGATAVRSSGLMATGSVWLSPAAAESLGLDVGGELVVQAGLKVHRLVVAGLLPAGAFRQELGLIDIAEAQLLFGRLGYVDRIDLRLEPGSDLAATRAAIGGLLPPGARLVTPGEAGDDALRLSRAYRTNLAALALVALFTGGFLVYSTQVLSVTRRRREIAFLHALGLTVREQLVATLVAGAVVGAVGAALGVALGIVAARAGLAAFGADLGAGYFRGLAPTLVVRPLECAVFFALGMLAAVGASLAPAREAAAVPPAAALRPNALGLQGAPGKFGSEPNFGRGDRAGLALLVLAAFIVWLPSPSLTAWPGYAAIACLLIGAVLLAPRVARAVFDRLPRGGPAWSQVATAQLRGTARTAAISLAAVLVSFSLMVAMAIMVQSFRASLDDWLQRILPADLYLRAGSSGTSAYFDPATQEALTRVAGVARIDFLNTVELSLPVGGPRIALLARNVDEATAAKRLPLRRSAVGPLPDGTVPVWVSEAAQDLHGLVPGTVFDLPLGEGIVRASVRGVWRDYDRPGGAVVVSRSVYIEHTGDRRATGASLWLAPGASADSTIGALRRLLPAGGVYEIARPQELRERSLLVFDRTFAVTYVIEAIAVLIGLVGVSAGISAQVLARRAEFGMLRHLGALRREIARLLAFEGAVQGALGVLGGLAVGGLVSLVLVYVVNRQSFHWTMDLHVPWAALATLSGLLIAAAAITAAVSGRLAMSGEAVQAVREDW